MTEKNGKLMRISDELAEQIREVAKKNNMKLIQASREISMISKVKAQNRKILKEIKF